MKKRKGFWSLQSMLCMVLSLVMVLGSSMPALAAPRFKDVNSSHWAYKHIQNVASLGIIIGDFEGNYNPENFIDKFDTSVILARILGYKGKDGNEAEQTRYAQINENWQSVIEANTSKFSKWKKYANDSIAFLLEHGVLTERDLYQFIVTVNGEERLRALTREEMAIFLVRTLGKVGETEGAENRVKRFSDHKEISNTAVPYVYYLREVDIVEGDLENRYNPKHAMTRAEMAKVVDITYDRLNLNEDSGNKDPDTSKPDSETGKISGTITSLYNRDANALRYKVEGTNKEVTKLLSPAISIYVNDIIATYDDLREGMTFTATLVGKDGDIKTLHAKGDKEIVDDKPDKDKLKTTDGIVKDIYGEDGKTYIELVKTVVDTDGYVNKENKKFRLASNVDITRGGKISNVHAINNKDLLIVEYIDDIVYSIKIENSRREFKGTLKAKHQVKDQVVFEIEDRDKHTENYLVNKDTRLYRDGKSNVTVSDLRIGDSVDMYVEDKDILTLEATGKTSDIDVIVESIYASKTDAYLVGRDKDGESKKYPIILSSVTNFSEVKVGSKVRIYLDSEEVSSIRILEEAVDNVTTGEVIDVSRRYIEVRDFKTGERIEFRFDDDTKVTNMRTGEKVTVYYIDVGMDVYVVTKSNSKVADTIKILDDRY